jgi:hypothetical protein
MNEIKKEKEKEKNEWNKTKWNEWRIHWNLGQDNINWKFGDLIKLWSSLINQIKSLIEELISLGT